MTSKAYYRPAEIAEILGISAEEMQSLLDSKEMPSVSTTKSGVLIPGPVFAAYQRRKFEEANGIAPTVGIYDPLTGKSRRVDVEDYAKQRTHEQNSHLFDQ